MGMRIVDVEDMFVIYIIICVFLWLGALLELLIFVIKGKDRYCLILYPAPIAFICEQLATWEPGESFPSLPICPYQLDLLWESIFSRF